MTGVNLNGILKLVKRRKRKSYHKLSEVLNRIDSGRFLIRDNARQCALRDFGWGISEIIDTYKLLRPKHFIKTDKSRINPLWVIDSYKAIIKGEQIYTHFYIRDDQGLLIINSFKENR